MSTEILSEERKEELRKYIKMNGGEVIDPEFKELEKFLELNPSEVPNT